MTSGFDAGELDLWAKEILNIAQKDMPKKTKKFMNQEGQKLKKITKQKAKQAVKREQMDWYLSFEEYRLSQDSIMLSYKFSPNSDVRRA